MANDSKALGKASLVTSIVGIAVPVILPVLVLVIEKRGGAATVIAVFFCGVLGVVLELVALGLGIAARRTTTGKAGMIISGILILLLVAAVFILDRFGDCGVGAALSPATLNHPLPTNRIDLPWDIAGSRLTSLATHQPSPSPGCRSQAVLPNVEDCVASEAMGNVIQ